MNDRFDQTPDKTQPRPPQIGSAYCSALRCVTSYLNKHTWKLMKHAEKSIKWGTSQKVQLNDG
jgi:hypothetical protein